jgi:hypothetical protein
MKGKAVKEKSSKACCFLFAMEQPSANFKRLTANLKILPAQALP